MKNNFYILFRIVNSPILLLLRITILTVLVLFMYINMHNSEIFLKLLLFEFICIVNELFIHEKLNKTTPKEKVVHATNVMDCLVFSLKKLFEKREMEDIAQAVSNNSASVLFRRKIGTDIPISAFQIDKQELLDKLQSVVLSVKGNYIYPVDVYAAILLILNKKEKILQKLELNDTDILYVLYWIRKELGIDKKSQEGIAFSGSGVFDFFVYGWSEQVRKYAENFTEHVLKTRYHEIIARDKEYELLVTALAKNTSSNALIVGHPGTGVTALISLFTYESNRSAVPIYLANRIVFKLLVDKLLAGVENQGDLEQRFDLLFSEIEHAGNVIVYIPYIENIFGGGGFDFDISGVLFNYLESNKIKIIGSTTPEAYKKYIDPKPTLHELFTTVPIEEPDNETALFILFEVMEHIEKMNHVQITFDAVKASVELSSSYISNGFLPSKAIQLLEDSVAQSRLKGKTTITKQEVMEFVEDKTHILLDIPSEEEKLKLLHMEDELHKVVVAQDEAVNAISIAMRRIRSGLGKRSRPLCSFLFLGPTGVGKTETAKALANIYFGSRDAMIRLDMSEYQTQDSIHKILGSDSSMESFADKVLANPFSLILLDEFEKAHPQILDLFLQVLDDARITTDAGKTVSFQHSIIIATSNAGSEFIRQKINSGAKSEELKGLLLEELLSTNKYKAELINRFDDAIVFKPLNHENVKKIASKMLHEVASKLEENQINVVFDDKVTDFVAQSADDSDFGARNIRRFIEQNIENVLSEKILDGSLKKFANNVVRLGENNTLTIATA